MIVVYILMRLAIKKRFRSFKSFKFYMLCVMQVSVTTSVIELSIHDSIFNYHAVQMFNVYITDIGLFMSMYYLFQKASKDLNDKIKFI